jgi:uncharacterized protein (DUF2141 family)
MRTRAIATVTLVAGLCASAAWAAGGGITAHVTALRSARGQVGCMLYASEQGFPKEPEKALRRMWCPISGSEARCAFDPVPAGTYAIACFHDENGNGKIDLGLFGIPKEGTAASNDAKGTMGPPSFADAKFAFSGQPAELAMRMSY